MLGQAMKRHAEEGLQSARPLLSNEVDLLAAQEGILGGDDGHGLLQGFHHHGSVALFFLQWCGCQDWYSMDSALARQVVAGQ